MALAAVASAAFAQADSGPVNDRPNPYRTIAADATGNIYGADVGPKAVKRYVKNP